MMTNFNGLLNQIELTFWTQPSLLFKKLLITNLT